MDIRYPKAVWKGDGISGGTFVDKPWRVVIHTTETPSLPGYNYGSVAPHFTQFQGMLYQHTSLAVASRSLYNAPGGVQTNRDNAIQIEIVAYTDKRMMAAGGKWIGDFTASDLSPLHDLILWVGQQTPLRMIYPPESKVFTFDEWDAYDGVCGHVNVPENVHGHWDPTGLHAEYLGLSVFGVPDPAPTPPVMGGDMFQPVKYKEGYGISGGSENVKVWQRLMVALGQSLVVDGKFGPATGAALQRLTGVTLGHGIDAIVGAKLIAKFAS